MNTEIKKFMEEKTKDILRAPSCCPELKEMAQKWLDAENTAEEEKVTKDYLQELSEDVLPIDALIGFASSEQGAQVFGAEQAKAMVEQATKAKAEGEKYCICPACSAGGAILDKKEEIEKF